jgi:hypothetical protein
VLGAHTAWAQFGLGQTNAAAKTIRDFLREFPDDAGELTAMKAVLRAAAGDAANAEIDIQGAQTKTPATAISITLRIISPALTHS